MIKVGGGINRRFIQYTYIKLLGSNSNLHLMSCPDTKMQNLKESFFNRQYFFFSFLREKSFVRLRVITSPPAKFMEKIFRYIYL